MMPLYLSVVCACFKQDDDAEDSNALGILNGTAGKSLSLIRSHYTDWLKRFYLKTPSNY